MTAWRKARSASLFVGGSHGLSTKAITASQSLRISRASARTFSSISHWLHWQDHLIRAIKGPLCRPPDYADHQQGTERGCGNSRNEVGIIEPSPDLDIRPSFRVYRRRSPVCRGQHRHPGYPVGTEGNLTWGCAVAPALPAKPASGKVAKTALSALYPPCSAPKAPLLPVEPGPWSSGIPDDVARGIGALLVAPTASGIPDRAWPVIVADTLALVDGG